MNPETTSPTTTATLSEEPNVSGWNDTDVTVSLEAVDESGGSGVKEITYSASGAQPIASTTVQGDTAEIDVTTEGETTIVYSAKDKADNAETPNTLTVRLDKTRPETTIGGETVPFIKDNTPTFGFGGSDNQTDVEELLFSYKVDEEEWSEYSSEASVTLGGQAGLSDGSHTIRVRTKDQAGNVDETPTERTFTVDTKLPTISSSKPTDDKTGVRRRANITATFSEEMRADTITDSTFILVNTKTGAEVSAEVSCDSPCETVTLNPWTKLARKTKYKAIITTDVTDLAGHAMEQNETWSFTIGRR